MPFDLFKRKLWFTPSIRVPFIKVRRFWITKINGEGWRFNLHERKRSLVLIPSFGKMTIVSDDRLTTWPCYEFIWLNLVVWYESQRWVKNTDRLV